MPSLLVYWQGAITDHGSLSSMTPNTLFTDTQGCRPATETILSVNSNAFSSSNTETPVLGGSTSTMEWLEFHPVHFPTRILHRRVRPGLEHRVESEDMERPMEYSRTTSTHQ
jgi:hypothetical protein